MSGSDFTAVKTGLLGLLLAVGSAHAQLSSPLPPGSSKPVAPASTKPAAPAGSKSAVGKAAPATAPLGTIDLPAGQGAGVHGANSPYAPLPSRTDVIAWSMLTDVKTKNEKNRIMPVFNASQLALNEKTQRIQGFMMPLEPGKKQRHFLLSSVPLTCSFCLPGGPESMIEVRTKTPVEYGMEAVVVEGRFLVLNDDANGLYYRITDAVAVK
ncbi:MAG TPA: DUF3299 domain-containing protein [Polaromonas sp.]|uniref:DUF3299 domain-containing protein n=1 Tax=Polaromonas sp. TaxID=1869339 RepID=UPI002D5C4FF6|nr:DUF3299 domain-containing protein [Polaromonas sp.]HYW57627.1 DUF3299 domain-containing protein [Polaromonas sp.]